MFGVQDGEPLVGPGGILRAIFERPLVADGQRGPDSEARVIDSSTDLNDEQKSRSPNHQ